MNWGGDSNLKTTLSQKRNLQVYLKEYYQIRSLQDQYLIQIPSITLDCFVDAPFYKCNELTGLESDTLDLLWIAENLQ